MIKVTDSRLKRPPVGGGSQERSGCQLRCRPRLLKPSMSPRHVQNYEICREKPSCATETSRNITARVIERDTSGEIYYFLEDSRRFRTRQYGCQSRQNGHQK
ncbi:hypothetical protein TNCV_1133861 [Trichonephila clavipes]|nr:hypothetical protein TNCV_1133861 [Trichonephila clavipes]